MSASYGWIIDKDYISEGKDVGVMGPFNTDKALTVALREGKGTPFKMYDDDGELYYEGRYSGPDDECLFGPLNDYGTPNAGCTEIHYKNSDGVFEQI